MDEVFVISRTIKVSGWVISRSRRLITLTLTLITLVITKTDNNNNSFIIHWTKKNEVMFLLLHWREATQSAQTCHYLIPVTTSVIDIIIVYPAVMTLRAPMNAFGQSEELESSMYNYITITLVNCGSSTKWAGHKLSGEQRILQL